MSPNRLPEMHCRVSELSSFSAMLSQLPCFRGVAELDPVHQLSNSFRIKRLLGVRMQIVAHENHLFAASISSLEDACHFHGPVDFRFGHPDSHLSPTREWFREHENIGSPRPFIFVINTLGVFGRSGNWCPGFFE